MGFGCFWRWAAFSPAAADKGRKNRLAQGIDSLGELGMPLDGPEKPGVRVIDRLNEPVRRHRHGPEGRGQGFDSLVVAAVDLGAVLPGQLMEGRPGRSCTAWLGAS